MSAVLALGAGAAMTPGAAHATVAATVTISQAKFQQIVARNDVLTATVTLGGSSAADGTEVQFVPQGGLLSDHAYSAFAETPSGGGYYLAAYNGTVRRFGDATVTGGTDGTVPIAGIALNPAGTGYYLLDVNGGIHPFGSSVPDYGDAATQIASGSGYALGIVEMHDGSGYWIMGGDGTVYQYTNGASSSYTPPDVTNQYPQTIVADPNGGFWVVYSGGGVRALDGAGTISDFSSLPSYDSLASATSNSTGTGLWGLTSSGTVVTTGSGVSHPGDLQNQNASFIGVAATPDNGGYFGLGWDGQVDMAGTATAPTRLKDAWSATTTNGSASIAVTDTQVGSAGVAATSLGGSSPVAYSEWSVPAGYWAATSAGGIGSEGDAQFVGAATQYHPATSTTAIASTPSGSGYWELSSAGGLFNFGDAGFNGAAVGLDRTPFVGMAAFPYSVSSYWLLARDGGVFAYNAPFLGSAHKYTADAVAITADPSGNGYWVVSATGAVFSFGAQYEGGVRSASPIVGMAATWDGQGYWLVNANGAVFAFGDAGYEGGAQGRTSAPIVGIVANPGRFDGYALIAANGRIVPLGSEPSTASPTGFATPIVGIAAGGNYYDIENSLGSRSHTLAPRHRSVSPAQVRTNPLFKR